MHKIHVTTCIATITRPGETGSVAVTTDVIEFETGAEAFTACGALNSRYVDGPPNTKVTRTATYLGNR
jgi:hypothetical protein